MTHFIKKCRACGTVLAQCRCPSKDKEIRWGECKNYPRCDVQKRMSAMTRHTREQVDSSLEWEAELRGDADPDDCDEAWQLHLCRLAAEVRALREELAAERLLTASYRKGAEESAARWNAIDDYDAMKAEVERLKAELERTTGGRMRDLLTDAEELCAKRTRQFRELREAAEGLVERWRHEARTVEFEVAGSKATRLYAASQLEAVLAKVRAKAASSRIADLDSREWDDKP